LVTGVPPGQLERALTELRRVWTWHLDFLPETTNVASAQVSVNPGDFQTQHHAAGADGTNGIVHEWPVARQCGCDARAIDAIPEGRP
jgi:hypothetical protein